MPQPLSKVRPSADVVMAPNAVAENPYLALLIAFVVNSSAYLEIKLGECLAELIRTKPKLGVTIFSSLTSTTAQLSVLKSVVIHVLTGKDRDLLLAIIHLAGKAISQRNDVVHGLWGYSLEIDDALLLVPSRVHLDLHAKIVNSMRGIRYFKRMPMFDRSGIFVYKKSDFLEISTFLVEVNSFFVLFWRMRRSKSPRRAQLRRELLQEPRVQKALAQIQKDQKNKSSSPRRKMK